MFSHDVACMYVAVPLEEDDSKIKLTLGLTIGGILLGAILIFLVYKM